MNWYVSHEKNEVYHVGSAILAATIRWEGECKTMMKWKKFKLE